jgi:hypothetical protein
MPILVLHYRNNGSAVQKLRMSSLSIPIQKLTLVSYAVNLSKFAGTLASGASHKVPDHIIVDIPEIIGQGCNVATPPVSSSDQSYYSSHGIPIPISDDLNTIQNLGVGLHFDINKKLNRELTIHIKKYNDSKQIVDMDTVSKNTGECQIDHLLLYFSYEFSGNF